MQFSVKDIDETLGEDEDNDRKCIYVEPYLPRKSIWDVLQMLCNASMSFVYVDDEDRICVRSELFERNLGTPQVNINPDNAFSVNIPFFADMSADRVEIPCYRKVVKSDQELYKKTDFKASVGERVTVSVEFDKYCEIEKVEYAGNECIINEIKHSDGSDFKYNISFTVKRVDDEKNKDLIVYGKEITFEKQILPMSDPASIKQNSFSLYTHPDCELIQNEDHAENIAERIMQLYPSGTRTVTSSWRGTEDLNLLETSEVKGRFGGEAEYMVTQIKNSVDGGFRQEIKGIRKLTVIQE